MSAADGQGTGGHGYAGSYKVKNLDIESIPRGTRARLLVQVASDGLGRPVRVPCLVVRGSRDGPVFGLTAALHGNEINGIPVLHRLVERTDPAQLRGTLVAVMVVNLPGFFQHRRLYSDNVDLNHIMPGRMDGNESQVYAARIFERCVKHFDYLIDLHTASFGRVNSLYVRADMLNPTTATMARLQRPQIILHNPPSDTTLRGAAQEAGIQAITVEIGDPQRFQPELIRRTLVGIRAMLGEARMLPKRKVALGGEPIVCVSSRWLYTDHGGLLEVDPQLRQMVAAGETVARVRNVFGDVIREYQAPHDGVVIGHSINPVGQTGARILHLGRPGIPS
ncbi:MAG: putative deacylase [Myxococcota bacterium]|jgi:predicted deacylase